MRRFAKFLVVCACLVAAQALAHDIEHHAAVVIDTDMGMDDAVALALALQSPRANIVSIVACEGAAGAEKSVEHLERMLHMFNRQDIALYAPAALVSGKTPPPFRNFAEESVGGALPALVKPFRRPFSPEAYISPRGKTVILALGPLTNLAAALQTRPEIKEGISKVIFAGSPIAGESWNVRFDPDALAAVRATGVPVVFVVPSGGGARKPETWREGDLTIGPGTSVGEVFFNRLLATPRVRQHYLERFESFYDELAFLYFVDETLFWGKGRKDLLVPNNRVGIVNLFTRLLADGRQGKHRVVFVEGSLPDSVFRKDVRERKSRIIAKNGRAEWFAQLLMNEMHEHLGAYSVVGVKMGLRAAELLNAPQHGMKVVSHVPPRPPVSCLNDGVIVATGCTPGRALFEQDPGKPGTVAVTFEYNGRRLMLVLKAEYRDKIKGEIKTLLDQYTLEDHEYWLGVRKVGLDIWENWHRRNLFDVVEGPAVSK